jgi:hypothetical protein
MLEAPGILLACASYAALYFASPPRAPRVRAPRTFAIFAWSISIASFIASAWILSLAEGVLLGALLAAFAWTAAASILPVLIVLPRFVRAESAVASKRTRTDPWAVRTAVATLGTVPPIVLAGVALARWLPFAESARLSIAYVATIPLWVAVACVAFLDARGWRAALGCLAFTLVMAAALFWEGA